MPLHKDSVENHEYRYCHRPDSSQKLGNGVSEKKEQLRVDICAIRELQGSNAETGPGK